MKIPQNIKEIISVINKNGYEAYIVGGAVRDSLLGIAPTDYDIATNCIPEKITEIFDYTLPTGIKHGTVTVIKNGIPTEITTYRIDGEYTDSRYPDSVEFTDDLSLDLSRRDFTINAMAYTSDIGLIDLFGGSKDIENKIIKTVGDPKMRFSEDALRILRAIRFACQLEFSIDENTLVAATAYAPTLSKISAERIFSELSKALLGKCGDALEHFINSGGLNFLKINKSASLAPIYELPQNLASRFFMFFKLTDADFEITASALKFSKNLHTNVAALLNLSDEIIDDDKIKIKQLLNKYSPELLRQFLQCAEPLYRRDYSTTKNAINQIANSSEPYKIAMLNINGKDLINLGFKGEIIGDILNDTLNECIINPYLNKKEKLIAYIKSKYSN